VVDLHGSGREFVFAADVAMMASLTWLVFHVSVWNPSTVLIFFVKRTFNKKTLYTFCLICKFGSRASRGRREEELTKPFMRELRPVKKRFLIRRIASF